MHKPYEVTNCEYCGSVITLESPPSKERYNRAEIRIDAGTMLLPDDVVEMSDIHKAHAVGLEGYYCKPKCLTNRIEAILCGYQPTKEELIREAKKDYDEMMDKAFRPSCKYLVLAAGSYEKLEELINQNAKHYKPVGGISCTALEDDYVDYHQLMEKRK